MLQNAQQSNLLLDPLPESVKIDGTEVEIDTDFRTSIRFALLMQNRRIDDRTKLELALYMFYGDAIPLNTNAAVDAILWFYRCGKESESRGTAKGGAARAYDFEEDAGLIYAAFWQQYGIDLQTAQLHWWQFRALFSGLTKDTEIMTIAGYRTAEITSDMPKSEQTRYRKLKEMYALKDNRTEEEKERDFAANLAML